MSFLPLGINFTVTRETDVFKYHIMIKKLICNKLYFIKICISLKIIKLTHFCICIYVCQISQNILYRIDRIYNFITL